MATTNTAYFIKIDGELIPCPDIQNYGYYQAGYQREEDKGVLSTTHFIPGIGTCLVPVFDKDGNAIKDISKAGKYYSKVN